MPATKSAMVDRREVQIAALERLHQIVILLAIRGLGETIDMMRKSGLRALFAVGAFSFGIAAAVPAGAEAPFGCACLHNDTKVVVKFRYKWGDGQWTSDYLRAGYQETLCWRYTGGSASSPPLGFQIDVDLTNGAAWTTYNLPRGQSQTNKCDAVPRQFHYDISYRPNTNNQFVQMTHRK